MNTNSPIRLNADSRIVLGYDFPPLQPDEIIRLAGHTPLLGPSCTMLLMIAAQRRQHHEIEQLTAATVGRQLGLAPQQLARVLQRLVRFGYVHHHGGQTFRFLHRGLPRRPGAWLDQ
jgi:hypothetical protein